MGCACVAQDMQQPSPRLFPGRPRSAVRRAGAPSPTPLERRIDVSDVSVATPLTTFSLLPSDSDRSASPPRWRDSATGPPPSAIPASGARVDRSDTAATTPHSVPPLSTRSSRASPIAASIGGVGVGIAPFRTVASTAPSAASTRRGRVPPPVPDAPAASRRGAQRGVTGAPPPPLPSSPAVYSRVYVSKFIDNMRQLLLSSCAALQAVDLSGFAAFRPRQRGPTCVCHVATAVSVVLARNDGGDRTTADGLITEMEGGTYSGPTARCTTSCTPDCVH